MQIPTPPPVPSPAASTEDTSDRAERRVPMTRLRATIANRLVEAQQTAAMLTTFNEVNMEHIMSMRRSYQEEFQAAHAGTRLGFMSFFVRASTEALVSLVTRRSSNETSSTATTNAVAVSTRRLRCTRHSRLGRLVWPKSKIKTWNGREGQNAKPALKMQSERSQTTAESDLCSPPYTQPAATAMLGMHKIEDVHWDSREMSSTMMVLRCLSPPTDRRQGGSSISCRD